MLLQSEQEKLQSPDDLDFAEKERLEMMNMTGKPLTQKEVDRLQYLKEKARRRYARYSTEEKSKIKHLRRTMQYRKKAARDYQHAYEERQAQKRDLEAKVRETKDKRDELLEKKKNLKKQVKLYDVAKNETRKEMETREAEWA